MDNVTGAFRQDFHRFRMGKLRQFTQRFHSAVNTNTTIKRGVITADIKGIQGTMSGVINLPYLAANAQILYSSTGGPRYEKGLVPDLVSGTLGNAVERHAECDNDDMSSIFQPNQMDQPQNFYDLGIQFFESGGDAWHLQRLGGHDWTNNFAYIQSHVTALRNYINAAPNVPARAPIGTITYNVSDTYNGNWDTSFRIPYQNLKGNTNNHINVILVDDSNTPLPQPVP